MDLLTSYPSHHITITLTCEFPLQTAYDAAVQIRPDLFPQSAVKLCSSRGCGLPLAEKTMTAEHHSWGADVLPSKLAR